MTSEATTPPATEHERDRPSVGPAPHRPSRTLTAAGDVYVYFDNDAHAHAPFDAIALAQRLRS